MKKSKYSSKMRGGRKATKYSSKMKKGSMTPTFNEVI